MQDINQDIIEFGGRLYDKGFIVATEGNISCRLEDNRILATVSNVNKGHLTPSDLVILDRDGNPLETDKQPSTEIKMHLKVYQSRSDVKAVIHAHPPYVISLSLAGVSLDQPYLPESAVLLGAVPTVPYARPSTGQVPQSIAPYLRKTDILILERHGSLTLGSTLRDAYHKLEILEHTARILWQARQLGSLRPIDSREVQELTKLREEVYHPGYPVIPFQTEDTDH